MAIYGAGATAAAAGAVAWFLSRHLVQDLLQDLLRGLVQLRALEVVPLPRQPDSQSTDHDRTQHAERLPHLGLEREERLGSGSIWAPLEFPGLQHSRASRSEWSFTAQEVAALAVPGRHEHGKLQIGCPPRRSQRPDRCPAAGNTMSLVKARTVRRSEPGARPGGRPISNWPCTCMRITPSALSIRRPTVC